MRRNLALAALPVLAVLLIAATGADRLQARAADEEAKGIVLINITSGKEDLHAVTMACQLAGHALDDGRTVVLFLNVRAPEFARQDLSEEFVLRDNPPLRDMLASLMARGAQMVVCPHCMEVMGVGEGDLIKGARAASRQTLFAHLGPDTVVFSY